MTSGHDLLQSLGIAICVAAATSYASIRLRQPPVLGYLLAGLIVGPYLGLPLVSDQNTITALSELGVILLMFFLGLEFSLRHLIQVGPRAFVIAFLEVGVMIFAGLSLARAFGFSGIQSLFFGGVVAIASTTSRDVWSATSPKIVWRFWRCGVGATVTKNCEPLVPGPAFAMAST